MLLFNVQERLQVDIYLHFNTSNVTIQHAAAKNANDKAKFQYI